MDEPTPIAEVTWNDNCKVCGKLYRDHTTQDLHDCGLTKDEDQKGLKK